MESAGLVEVVHSPELDPAAFEAMCDLGRRMGKLVLETDDIPGFVLNRIIIPMMSKSSAGGAS